MRRFVSWIAVAVCASSIGCSIPLEVSRVQPLGPSDRLAVEGVRYRLKRPTTSAAFRLNPKIDRAGLGELAVLEAEIEALQAMGTGGESGCKPYRGDVLIEQKMTEVWVYEARYRPNLLASTDVAITLGDSGELLAVSAGETDEVLPFVTAVAGLAVSAAKMGAGFVDDPCVIPELASLATREVALREAKLAAMQKLEAWRSKLRQPDSNSSPRYSDAKAIMEALVADVARIDGLLAKNRHTLKADEALICVDGVKLLGAGAERRGPIPKSACAADATGSWLRIDLRTQA